MSDIRCAAAFHGNVERAGRAAGERGWRFILALISDDPDAAEAIVRQIGDCPTCLRAFAWHLGGVASGLMFAPYGRENAAMAAQIALNEVLNTPDLLE